MLAPTVSVIIPTYNCGHLVAEAVDSVRAQTYRDFEVIVVDDGSTDDTWPTIEKLAASWGKIRAIHSEHAGLAAARNRAIARMRGEWIALLDADDLWEPQKLQRCMDYLAAHRHLRIVYTPMAPIREDRTPMIGHSKPCHAGQLTEKLFESIFVHDPAAVFHKLVIEACGGFDESLPVCVGHEFWLRVSAKFEFGLIDEALALRRWSETSLTRANRLRGRLIKAKMLERFYFEKGGRELLAANVALPRLARVHYSAGKILLAAGRYQEAAEYLRKAMRYRPGLLKSYPVYLAARAAAMMEHLTG